MNKKEQRLRRLERTLGRKNKLSTFNFFINAPSEPGDLVSGAWMEELKWYRKDDETVDDFQDRVLSDLEKRNRNGIIIFERNQDGPSQPSEELPVGTTYSEA